MSDYPHDGTPRPLHTPEPWTVFKDEYGIPVQTRFYIKKGVATICAMNTPCLLYAKGEKDANRIVACVNACAGMDDPAAEIDKLKLQVESLDTDNDRLREMQTQNLAEIAALKNVESELIEAQKRIGCLNGQLSADNLHKIFSESFEVNEYRGGWKGDWPELRFFIHEVWKRDPVVTQLRANQQVLMDALTDLSDFEDAPDLAAKDMRFGLHCGLEDKDIMDRYSAADYGWLDCEERYLEWVKNIAREALNKIKESENEV